MSDLSAADGDAQASRTVLASDADRERAVERLRTAAGEGLSPFVAVSLLLVAIWALSGAGYFWPVWPILGWGFFAVGPCGARHRRRGTLRA